MEKEREDAESCGWGRNVTANFLLNISPDGFYVFSSVGRVSDFTYKHWIKFLLYFAQETLA